MPSKALLRAAEAFYKAGHHPFQGIQTQACSVHLGQVSQQKDALVGSLREEKYAEVLASAGVSVIRGQARFMDEETLEVEGQVHQAKQHVLATGATATLPPIPDLAVSRPWTYIEALSPDIQPKTLLVIGGGAIGLEIAARNALGGKEELDLKAVPRVIFTDPALATVGLSEEEARRQYGSAIRVSRLPLAQLPKALVQHNQRGMFKLVVDGEGTVLGLSILAPEAGDALQEAVLAVKFGLHYHDLIETFHPYLTLPEGIRLVAQALDTEVGLLSCCA